MDAQFVDHKGKKVWAVEMSCLWVENRGKKDEEKTAKYGPLRWELRKQYPRYNINQCNIVINVLGRWSKELELTMKKLVGVRAKEVLQRIQKDTISCSLNIACTFKATACCLTV